jgi:CRP-like cAMP-binding protein
MGKGVMAGLALDDARGGRVCPFPYTAVARAWLFLLSVADLQLTQNLLVAAMPPESQQRFAAAAQVDEVQVAQRMFYEEEILPYVYFPLDSVVSLLRTLADGEMVEVGMIGAEGIMGVNAVFGVRQNPHAGVCQGRGQIALLPVSVVTEEMTREPRVNAILHHFTYAFYAGVSQLAACNRRHNVEQRLAQWLLLLRDRVGTDEMSLTHEFLSFMLATRRAGITEAMSALTAAGAIEPRRNRVRLIDRAKLESLSCECYGASFAEYEGALGFPPVAKGRSTPVD